MRSWREPYKLNWQVACLDPLRWVKEENFDIFVFEQYTSIAEHLVEFLDLCNALHTKTSRGISTFVQLTNYYDTL